MTEKEYEGAPELIFYCEYNPNDFEDRLEIPFTNEYDIKLDFSRDEDNKVCINVDLQPKKSTIPKDFFGNNVLNVTAIAGKNGVGKTNTLQNIKKLSQVNYGDICGNKIFIILQLRFQYKKRLCYEYSIHTNDSVAIGSLPIC